jgi:hypothetical protein
MSRKYHVTTTVNGDECEYLCEPQQTLLDALRDTLMLTGTKEGCATGDCGACTVMVDGIMICSCLMLAVASPNLWRSPLTPTLSPRLRGERATCVSTRRIYFNRNTLYSSATKPDAFTTGPQRSKSALMVAAN